MLKLIVSLLVLSTALFGAYDVKIGVYKNEKNLRANIAKIKHTKYRKSIIVEKKRGLYYAHAVLESNKDAKNALKVYKRIFNDAFIAKRQVKHKQPVKKITKSTPKPKAVAEVKKEESKEQLFAKQILLNKKVYLCYEKEVDVMNKRIVQMHFKDAHAEYQSLEGGKKPLEIKYTFVQDTILLPLSGLLVTHKILEKKNNFLSVKSYINGKEAHSLRYYFDKESALSFVESK